MSHLGWHVGRRTEGGKGFEILQAPAFDEVVDGVDPAVAAVLDAVAPAASEPTLPPERNHFHQGY